MPVLSPAGSGLPASHQSRRATIAFLIALSAWLMLYGWRTAIGHMTFATNAYDLSLFDYAIRDLAHGGRGFVPFVGNSIFSHHFMPILWVICPIYAVAPDPLTLLLLQVLATAAAAWLFLRVQQQRGMDGWLSAALALVFLLSRRTHGALAGSFYPESLQAPLTFAMVLLWTRGGWRLWTCIVLLLMTKEDAAVYVAGFAAVAYWRSLGSRRTAATTFAIAGAWLALAILVAIPTSRTSDGLTATNPIIEGRYRDLDSPQGRSSLVVHVVSAKSGNTLVNISLSAGLLPLFGVWWIAPAAAGIVANLAASPESMQAALTGHYAWPVLPWVFLAASAGALWIHQRSRRLAAVWVATLLLVVIGDNPALQRIGSTRMSAEASQVHLQLRGRIGANTILAQPNLIPHLPANAAVFAIGGPEPTAPVDIVLLTIVGDLWPMTPDELQALIAKYRADPRFAEVESGPLYAFQRK